MDRQKEAKFLKEILNIDRLGGISDGYHTFDELYHHRAMLFSVICNTHKGIAWKSLYHHDGTMYDGMFIVGINTPDGQATYHYDVEPYWNIFDVPVYDKAPEWDGHSPDDAIHRILLLGQVNKIKSHLTKIFMKEKIEKINKSIKDYREMDSSRLGFYYCQGMKHAKEIIQEEQDETIAIDLNNTLNDLYRKIVDSLPATILFRNVGETYHFTTEEDLNNVQSMSEFLDKWQVPGECVYINDGTQVILQHPSFDFKLQVDSSGDGDFYSHKIETSKYKM